MTQTVKACKPQLEHGKNDEWMGENGKAMIRDLMWQTNFSSHEARAELPRRVFLAWCFNNKRHTDVIEQEWDLVYRMRVWCVRKMNRLHLLGYAGVSIAPSFYCKQNQLFWSSRASLINKPRTCGSPVVRYSKCFQIQSRPCSPRYMKY